MSWLYDLRLRWHCEKINKILRDASQEFPNACLHLDRSRLSLLTNKNGKVLCTASLYAFSDEQSQPD